ncbi:MAG: site-specific DNA-methyltransferase [Mesotoga sp.]|jgi:adenine-specific DNA-methyltransferase|nr:site-specific DNA-methyltransferase [Mesotoga sp.]
MDKMKQETADLTQENIARIGELFPNVITEMKDEKGKLKKGINFNLLKQLLSGDVVDGEECYDFTWVGKKASIVEANTPIRKTLRPCIEESKNWETTENLYIEGDNLDVLKLLQESYLNSVKMIYIDPPYNTGKDFIYKDKFIMDKKEYEEQIGMYDEVGNHLFQNTETNGRFHSDWCSMMYPRLKLARSLLTEDGVIFISIDDNEVHNLRKICDEIFGESNFVTEFAWEKKKKPSFLHKNVGKLNDYILCYVKNSLASHPFSVETTTERKKYPFNNAGNGLATLTFPARYVKFNMPDGIVEPQDMSEGAIVTQLLDTVQIDGGYNVNSFRLEGEWRYSQAKLDAIVKNSEEIVISKVPFRPNHIKVGGEIKKMKNVLSPIHYQMETNEDATQQLVALFGADLFDNPKPVKLLNYLIRAVTYATKDAMILDFFSGSATTAHAVMQLNAEDGGNRKFIMVQLPEPCDEKSEAFKAGYKNICEIGKERIRRAGDKINKEIEESNRQLKLGEEPKKPVDIGFRVLKVDSTNMKDVFYAPSEYTQKTLTDQISNIKDDRTDLDLLYGVLLEWGLPLSMKHEIEEIDGIKIHIVDNDSLIACFAENISEAVVREIAKRQPLRAVFRDSSFASSSDKINVEEIFKLLAPNTSVKVI